MSQPAHNPDPALAAHLRAHDVRCKHCGYNLRGLTNGTCPECNTTYMLAGGTPIGEAFAGRTLRELPACPTCGYDRSGLSSPICPECGYDPRLHSPLDPTPPASPMAPIHAVDIPAWVLLLRKFLEFGTTVGHLVGILSIAAGFVAGLVMLVMFGGSSGAVLPPRLLLATVIAGVTAFAALTASKSLHRRERGINMRPRLGFSHLGLAWLWAIAGFVAYIV